MEFGESLISFLAFASEFQERARYYGDCRLSVRLVVPGAKELRPGTFRGRLAPKDLFDPRLGVVRANLNTEVSAALNPLVVDRILGYFAAIMNDVALENQSVFGLEFDGYARKLVEEAVVPRKTQ